MNNKKVFFMLVLAFLLACNLPGGTAPVQPPAEIVASTPPPVAVQAPVVLDTPSLIPEAPTATLTPSVLHIIQPADSAPLGSLVYDVESASTAPEKRAPYGDSYQIDRLERPFLKDMTYVSDLDISTFNLGKDTNWYYVSIDLIGSDPNNVMGIHYGVEIDTNHDGFGDHVIWASPPYTTAWSTANVKIYSDKNRDTAGLSPERSDAPIATDGYESLTFNGGVGDTDPDLAWVRINAGAQATVQFAFKSSWSGGVFMLGVLADAGLKDVTKLDYVDRFKEENAGSPVKDKKYYPLGELFAVDNTCQEAFGFNPTGYEPKLCPKEPPATKQPHDTQPGPTLAGCQPSACGNHQTWSDALCRCVEVLY
jgi:hypothetical protein